MTILLVCGCGRNDKDTSAGCAVNEVSHATMLKLEDKDGYSVAEVLGSDGKTLRQRYILLPREDAVPSHLPQGIIIRTPLRNAVIFSDVYGAVLDELRAVDVVGGVADSQYFSTDAIIERIRNGKIKDVGAASSPSPEAIAMLRSEGIILSIYDGMDVKGIDKLKVPVIFMAENLEDTPLGKAEWIRFIGRLVGKRNEADSIFNAVAKRYMDLQKDIADQGNNSARCKVLMEMMYEGVWYVPGGKSYQARLLEDAGAEYPWKGKGANGSLNLSYEQVLAEAADADVWLIKGFGPMQRAGQLISCDGRYAHFKAIRNGGVYYCDTSSIDIFQATTYHPDLLLKEYFNIFRGNGDLRYFKKLEQ